MGWWDTGVLGGDPALDVVGAIEDLVGVEELYPLDAIAEHPQRDALVAKLTEMGLDTIADRVAERLDADISAQVTAAVAMAAGVPIGTIAEKAKTGCRNDEWANDASETSAPERRARLDEFIALIDAYDGTPTVVDSPGLFAKLAEHI